jgi:hypothetical protein
MEAVKHILGDPHPALIDDYIFLAMLDREFDGKMDQVQLNEARKRYEILFGLEGRPFDHHVQGLRKSVSAPRCCF